jgi:hypothetical protein
MSFGPNQSATDKLLRKNEQGERDTFGSPIREEEKAVVHGGEIQPPMYRDKWFGIAFWLHIGTLVTVAILFKVGVIEVVDHSNDSNHHRRLEDNLLPGTIFLASSIATPLVVAPLLSIQALSVMSNYAVFLIKLCLIMNIVLNVIFFILCLVTAPLTCILPGIMAVVFIWYAKAVWDRIPLAAVTLRTGVAAILDDLGIPCLSLSVIPMTIGWVLLWFYVTFMFTESKWFDSQISERQVTDDSSGETTTHIEKELSGVAWFCFFLLLLSLYWTCQVIYNVIHTTVAGTVGTWWFIPHEANSCCSQGLTDSFSRSMTYSFGSICLGSLLVAILEVLRALLNNAAQNDRGGLITCIAQCLLSCLESLLEYFNRWAFVYVGIYGYSYVEAGKNVMNLFRYRGWTTIINDNLVHGVLSQMSFCTGLVTAMVVVPWTLLFGTRDIHQILLAALVGLIIGAIMSSIIFGGLHSSIDTIIVLYAEAPSEFEANHPELALEMNVAWSMAYPDVFTRSSAALPASRNANMV